MRLAIVITLFLLCGTAQAGRQPNSKHHPTPAEAWAQTSFARCVRWRESNDGAIAQNLYEIEGPHRRGNYGDYGWLNGVPRAKQNEIAYKMFIRRGDGPWRPYDHCSWEMYYPHNGY